MRQTKRHGRATTVFEAVTERPCQTDYVTKCLDLGISNVYCTVENVGVCPGWDVKESTAQRTDVKLCWSENNRLQSASAPMKTDVTHQPHASSDL